MRIPDEQLELMAARLDAIGVGRRDFLKVVGAMAAFGGGPHYFILGSRASRTPSPKNVKESMVIAMAIDGKTQRCQ